MGQLSHPVHGHTNARYHRREVEPFRVDIPCLAPGPEPPFGYKNIRIVGGWEPCGPSREVSRLVDHERILKLCPLATYSLIVII